VTRRCPEKGGDDQKIGATDIEKHLIQAAERGNADAQFNLAVMYANGLLDSRYVAEGSRSEAVRWFLAAAEQGLARAQVKLAEIYAADPDQPDGSPEACKWYLLAMGELRGGHLQKVQSAYQRVAMGLTPVQTAEVSRFVESWTPKGAPIATISDRLEITGQALA
jgi:TPR repeat protein